MLYFIHHPAGNVVLLTNNAYIVLSYQRNGWLTTTAFDDVLAEHPEWRTPPTPTATTPEMSKKGFAATLFSTLFGSLSGMLAFVPSYSPSGVGSVAPLLADTHHASSSTSREELPSDTGPIHWLTAIERVWYSQRGLTAPAGSWITCTEGDDGFEYRLEEGIWELELAPTYTKSEKDQKEVELDRRLS